MDNREDLLSLTVRGGTIWIDGGKGRREDEGGGRIEEGGGRDEEGSGML